MRRKPNFDPQRGDWLDVRRGAWQFLKFGRVWLTESDMRPCRWLENRVGKPASTRHRNKFFAKRPNRANYNYLELREFEA